MELMEAETYLTPDKALEYGLIDEVYGKKAIEPKPDDILEKLSQMQKQLNSQQSFREQIAELREKQSGNPGGASQKNGLLQLFKGMARKGE
ncbi:MAG: hypothetical protein ACLTF1_09970 [Clostridium sp.]